MFQFPTQMLKVFKDENLQNDFEKNGFVIVPFYDKKEIEHLTNVYYDLHPSNEQGFFPSTFSNDKNYRHQADEIIRDVCNRSITHYFENIKVVCGSFIVKNPSADSGMCVHQDMSLVDESKYTGINIWVPLTDLTIENGALFVLPKSHRLFPTYRGSSISEFFSPVMDEIIDYLEPVTNKAGEAVIFDQSIIHFSPPNYSGSPRIVTNTYLTHKDTKYRTYYWQEDYGNQIEAFEQADDFMTNFEQFGENIQARPKVGNSLGFVDYNFPKIDVDFLNQQYKKTNARTLIEQAVPKLEPQVQPKSTGFLEKIKTWLS